ncbi:hypothetical protein ACIO13_30515 [Streptomyces sp. NPDC087425]|uniref:hypothetical protein n=1 Tax=Streptomyces sp. NPDC087425 TaxID=3365787 RepID=UPI0038247703
MTEDRRLLEPMATVVSVALRTLLGLAATVLILNVARGTWGGSVLCITDDSAVSSVAPGGFLPEHGAVAESVPRYCADHPGAFLRLLDGLGSVPSTLLLISGLFLLHRLLQGAAREGVHTELTASRFRLLGRWLLLGSLLCAFVEANAKAALIDGLSRSMDYSAAAWLGWWSTPYLAILTGLGLLTFARITRAGTSMREDLEGVV